MGKKLKAAQAARASEAERLMNARKLIWDAIGEINQSKTAIHLTRQLSELYNIEDVLWQFATAMKGE